jgi:hypothetical protein
MKLTYTFWAFSIATAMQLPGAASAQDTQLQGQLQSCARLQNSAERLSCYDRTVASIGQSDAPPSASPEAMFGVGGQLLRENTPIKAVEREEIPSINAQVKGTRTLAGVLLIDLDNGQTWQQMEDAALLLKAGDRVTITRGAFNSFRLSTASKRNARVKRLQ